MKSCIDRSGVHMRETETVEMCLSYRELTNRRVRTRKNHMCGWCSETIYKKELARYRSYVLDGDMTSDYMHVECYDAMCNSDNRVICEGWMAGDFERGVSVNFSNVP